jgi:hypothetical protein
VFSKRSAIRRVGSSIFGFWGFAMSKFNDLYPEIRCYALVGQFLQTWSVMEGALHNAIGTALSIETTKLQILCANIRFRDKIHILSTLIDVAPIFSNEVKTEFRKALRQLAEYSHARNMVAHDPFRLDASKEGVEFLTVKAKGKFDLPNEIWNVDRFQSECTTIDQYHALLDGLAARFQAQPLPSDALIYAGMPLPMRQPISPALWDSLSRQPQALPDNGQANQEEGAQTPEKLQE